MRFFFFFIYVLLTWKIMLTDLGITLIELLLHPWDESHLIMVYDHFIFIWLASILLKICIYIYQGY